MQLSYTYWQNDDFYIGHLNEYPEYDTQGKSLPELEAMLKSLYEYISSASCKELGELEYWNYTISYLAEFNNLIEL